jgi:hypothetical protein
MLPGPLFGWSDAYPHQFLIRGKSFRVRSNGEANEAGAIRLSEFQFYVRERFFYDYRFDLQTPVWRHEIRVEKVAPVRQEWQYPRCVGGAGTPPPEPVAGPQEFLHIRDLFTPSYILHHLAEVIDRGADDQRIAKEVRHLRPWLTAGEFSNRAANQQLAAARAGAVR